MHALLPRMKRGVVYVLPLGGTIKVALCLIFFHSHCKYCVFDSVCSINCRTQILYCINCILHLIIVFVDKVHFKHIFVDTNTSNRRPLM